MAEGAIAAIAAAAAYIGGGTAAAGGATAGGLAAAGASAAGTAVIAGAPVALTAGGAAATAGLTSVEIATLAAAAASTIGTGAQLLQGKPSPVAAAPPPSRDDAQKEADLQSQLYRKRGRGSALLTSGAAKGDTSSPNLGSSALLGA